VTKQNSKKINWKHEEEGERMRPAAEWSGLMEKETSKGGQRIRTGLLGVVY